MLKRVTAIAAILALSVPPASSVADWSEDFRRFQLWSNCEPMSLVVEELSENADRIGLRQESIIATAERGLRSVRLYDPSADRSYLYVVVTVGKVAYSIRVAYNKLVRDTYSDLSFFAQTWDRGAVGLHGDDPERIRLQVRDFVTAFVIAHGSVNAEFCDLDWLEGPELRIK